MATRTNKAVSVGTTATLLSAAAGGRSKLCVTNNGSVNLYLGDASVTTVNGGLIIGPLQTMVWEEAGGRDEGSLGNQDAWYGIVASGTCDTRVVEA